MTGRAEARAADAYLPSSGWNRGEAAAISLEALIYERLAGDEELGSLLAAFDGRGAVFYQRAPMAGSAKWPGDRYPRVDFSLDLREEPEKGRSGILIVNIWCAEESGAEPEAVEAALRRLMHMAFVKTEESGWFGFFWSRTDAFDSGAKDGVYGASVLFDLVGLPEQEIGAADPVRAIGEWMETGFAGAAAVGGAASGIWARAMDDAPFVYWRAGEMRRSGAQFACEWIEGELFGHVFAPSAAARLRVAARLRDAVADAGHVWMADAGPMRIAQARLRPGGDYLTGGQVAVGVNYGRLPASGGGGATGDVLWRVTIRGGV